MNVWMKKVLNECINKENIEQIHEWKKCWMNV